MNAPLFVLQMLPATVHNGFKVVEEKNNYNGSFNCMFEILLCGVDYSRNSFKILLKIDIN